MSSPPNLAFCSTGLCGGGTVRAGHRLREPGNLLLARSLARQRELSIRLSLGASRRNLLRQLPLREPSSRACRGRQRNRCRHSGLAAALRVRVPNALPIQQVPPVDAQTLLFALGLTLITVHRLRRLLLHCGRAGMLV